MRSYYFFLSLTVFFCFGATQAIAQNDQQAPSIKLLKQLFPAQDIKENERSNYKSWKIDLNGDGKKEWIVVENPNNLARQRYKELKKKGCLCKRPAFKGVFKKIRKALKWRKSIYKLALVKARVKNNLKIYYLPKKSPTRSFDKWLLGWCYQINGQKSKFAKWSLSGIHLVNIENGTNASIDLHRCKKLARISSERRKKRYFKRWKKQLEAETIRRCPCSQKTLRSMYPSKNKPLQIVVATELKSILPENTEPQKKSESAEEEGPSLRIVGRIQGEDIQLEPITKSGAISAIRIEKTTLGTTTQTYYVYDASSSGSLRKVFHMKVAQGMGGKDPGARMWTKVKLRNMDADDWLEIVVDSYYENPQFAGKIQRRMYKWNNGKYEPLNAYRGILRARASSTWKRNAPKGTPFLRKVLRARSWANNVVDGFRGTSWVGQKFRRSVGDWIRVELASRAKLLGVAIAVKVPMKMKPIISKLYPNSQKKRPTLAAPRYVVLKLSSGSKMSIALNNSKRYHFIRFKPNTYSSYIQINLTDVYQKGKAQIKMPIPKNERTLGFISEIVPIFDRTRYTASSSEKSGLSSFIPRNLGDMQGSTGWAEGRKDNGIGEWVQMIMPMPKFIKNIKIVNGCQRPGERYVLNNRVKKATLTFSNGSKQEVTFKDNNVLQVVKIQPVRTISVKLTIRSIYKGKVGKTSCISELRL